MDLLSFLPAPRIQSIQPAALPAFDVLRLDEIHPVVSGNKWYKLKYNLLKIQQETARYPELPCQLLTFGGAYSNHIHATAAAGHALGIPTIGIIRGEEPAQYSTTLADAKNWGMRLEFISRSAYAEKDTDDFKSWLYEEYGHLHIVPEGGSNYLGVNGCMDILESIDLTTYSVVACAMGTGATISGLLLSTPDHIEVWGFPVLKGGEFLREEIRKQLIYFLFEEEAVVQVMKRLRLFDDFHFGGYGKVTPELMHFIATSNAQYNLPLDRIYTAKALWGLQAKMKENDRVLFIHTGGLQGNRNLH